MQITATIDIINKNQAGYKGNVVRTEKRKTGYAGETKEVPIYSVTAYIERDVWEQAGRPTTIIITL